MGKMLLTGYDIDGMPYSEAFNSYYLAVVKKNEMVKQGCMVELTEIKEGDRKWTASSKVCKGTKIHKGGEERVR